jgi:NTP pyrophosphatase (non-canonical NTP hydrolase)
MTEQPFLNSLASEAFSQAKTNGFYELAAVPDDIKTILIKLLLINGEVNEVVEVLRFGLPKERLHEELADVFIRLFDLAGYVNMDVDAQIRQKMHINLTRPLRHNKRF